MSPDVHSPDKPTYFGWVTSKHPNIILQESQGSSLVKETRIKIFCWNVRTSQLRFMFYQSWQLQVNIVTYKAEGIHTIVPMEASTASLIR